MPRKTYSKKGSKCRVTFELPAGGDTQNVSLCGDFNGWDPGVQPMKRRKDGRFSTTLSLTSSQDYRFKYLLDGHRWENDWNADSYVPNCFGTEDSLIRV
jgi:1,4-alpha-glucan branching enzyme